MCGIDVDERAREEITLSADGVSLLQLRDVCETWGVPAEVRKFRADEVWAMPLPAIWQSRSGDTYHYYVVYMINEGGIYALDGTTAAKMRIKQDRLADGFTGYALIPKPSLGGHLMAQIPSGPLAVWLAVGLNVVLLGVWVVQRQRRG